jgi:Uma2 family endonuclease
VGKGEEHDVPGRMTIAEFQRLPEDDEFLFELDEGMLVREPRPARPHGTVVILMGMHLAQYALEHGGVVTTETGYVLAEDPDTLRGPDVAYTREDPTPYRGDPAGFIRGAPDLAVEVLSPSNRWTEVRRRVDQYFVAGARMVWIVDPASRSVTVHPTADRARTVGHEGTLDGADVLPGFTLPVAELFRF